MLALLAPQPSGRPSQRTPAAALTNCRRCPNGRRQAQRRETRGTGAGGTAVKRLPLGQPPAQRSWLSTQARGWRLRVSEGRRDGTRRDRTRVVCQQRTRTARSWLPAARRAPRLCLRRETLPKKRPQHGVMQDKAEPPRASIRQPSERVTRHDGAWARSTQLRAACEVGT